MATRDHFVPVHHLAKFRCTGSPVDRKARAFVAFVSKDNWVEAPVESFGWDEELYKGQPSAGTVAKDIDPAFWHPENKGRKLLNQLVDGTAPNLQSVKYGVGEYIASMAWRTPVGFGLALQGIFLGEKGSGLIRDGKPGFSEFDDAMLAGLQGLPGIGPGQPRNLHELILNRVADEIQTMALSLITMRWEIIDVDPQTNFITSDQPVFWDPHHMSNGFFSFGSHWERPETKILFPIAPNRILWAHHHAGGAMGVKRQVGIVSKDVIDVSRVNRLMLSFAGQFVVSSTQGFPGDDVLAAWRVFCREKNDKSPVRPGRPFGS